MHNEKRYQISITTFICNKLALIELILVCKTINDKRSSHSIANKFSTYSIIHSKVLECLRLLSKNHRSSSDGKNQHL